MRIANIVNRIQPALIALGVAFLSVSDATGQTQADFEKAVGRLSDPSTSRSAEAALERLATGRDPVLQLKARVALSQHKRAAGSPEAASKWVMDYAAINAANLADDHIKGFIEAAFCQSALGRNVSAYKMLDYGKAHSQGIPAVRIGIAFADMVEAVPDLCKALTYLRETLDYGNQYFKRQRIRESVGDAGPLTAAKPGDEQWPALRKTIEARIKDLERRLEIERLGLDYVLYRDAQALRKPNDPFAMDFCSLGTVYPQAGENKSVPSQGADYPQAIAIYDQIIEKFPEGMLADASRLYRCVCLAKLGRINEAITGLEAFCKADPDGLYRGEALKLLGDLALQDAWDLKTSGKYYLAAITWCEGVQQRTRAARLYAVPGKCAEVSKAPDSWQQMDEYGVIEQKSVPEGAIINRTTTPWYLNRLREQLHFALGFTLAASGKWDEAGDQFQRAAAFNELLTEAEKRKYLNAGMRLKGSCEKKAFVGTDYENQNLRGTIRTAIMWADFCHMRQEFTQAISLYERIYAQARAKRDSETMARAGLGMMVACLQTKEKARLRQVGAEVVETCPRARSTPYVAFVIGHSYGPDKDGTYATAVSYYKKAYTLHPTGPMAENARFYEFFKRGSADDIDETRRLISEFRRDYPNSVYIPALDNELEHLAANDGRFRAHYAQRMGEEK